MVLSQKVAFNTLVQIVSKAITVVFGLLTTILLTTHLGRSGYGDYMYILSLVIIFGAFADWGTATIGVREASKIEKKKQGRALANVFLVRLILAFLAAILMFLVAFFIPLQSTNPFILRKGIMIGSLMILLFAIKASFGIVFQTKLEMQKLAVADIIISFLVLSISWFLIKGGWGLLPLVRAVVLANLFGLVIAWFLVQRTIRFEFRLDRQLIDRFVKESLPMGAILLMFTIDNKIDTVMLGLIKGSQSVGIYAVAYKVYDVLILGAAYLMNALLPVISRYTDLNRYENRLKQIYQKAFDVLLMMGMGVVIFVWLFAPLIVKVLTQYRFSEFGDSVTVLRILSFALFLIYLNHLIGYTIVALGKQRHYFYIALSSLIFNVIANWLVIPRFSYFGAAAVTILTECLLLVITSVFIFRLMRIIPSVVQFPRTAIQLIKQKGKIF